MSGLNRIAITIPGSSSLAQAERDQAITQLKAMGITLWDYYHYTDASPLDCWGYYAIGVDYTDGIMVVATVTCTGMAHPPSGSNLVAMADPGLGVLYPWASLGAPCSIRTSGDSRGGTAPTQNSGYNVWTIPANSSTAATDFTAAIAAVNANLSSFVAAKYFKYVDSVSGAWQVSAIWFAPGYSWFAAGAAVASPNDNIFYMVTCSGTPNPPTGSQQPAVTIPAFTQTFTTLTGPLSFGPMR